MLFYTGLKRTSEAGSAPRLFIWVTTMFRMHSCSLVILSIVLPQFRLMASIDKYSQVYRILLPITNVLGQIPSLMEKPAIRSYIEDEFGSDENLYKEILGDFFRHGFDGSGADNVCFHRLRFRSVKRLLANLYIKF